MPNIRGGKAYKKLKGASNDMENVEFIEKQDDQMVGHVVRLLGNRNTSVYCEDTSVRICKISNGIKKGVKIYIGDLVLLSLRDCEVSKTDLAKGIRSTKGDILAKYSPLQYAQLKADGINPKLFAQVETLNAMVTKIGEGDLEGADALAAAEMEDYFEARGTSANKGDTEEGGVDIDAI